MGFDRNSNFVKILQEHAALCPDKVIFTFLGDGEAESGHLTYSLLDRQARAIAAYLQEKKGLGERALLLYQPGLEFISAFLGCLYAGVIATPAYPPRPNRSFARLEAIIKDAGAKFALTTGSLKEKIEQKLTQNKSIICLATDNLNWELADHWQELSNIKPESIAFLQYTSGSTGTPKGVMVSHENLIHNSYLIKECFQNSSQSIGGSWLPPYHDMGLIGGILQPIYTGISTIMLPPVSFLQRPVRWLKAISKYKITTTGGPNFAYEMCVNSITSKQKGELDLSSWELAFSGAEPVRADTIAKFSRYFADCGFRQQAFYPCYGMAETTLIVSGANKNSNPVIEKVSAQALTQNQIVFPETDSNTKDDSQELVSSGRVAPELEVIIVNPETLRECQSNQVGEIWVRGDSVTQGYWKREDLTQNIFHVYTKDTHKGPFLRTGDLGFIGKGELFVTGRLKDLIIIRGRNHYPQDIEETVSNCHGALNSDSGAAFALDIDGEEQLVIVFELKRTYIRKIQQDSTLEQEIFDAVRQAIAANHELQVSQIVLLKTGSIPKTSSGKIARHACRQDFLDGNLDVISYSEERGSRETAKRAAGETGKRKQGTKIEHWLTERIAKRLGLNPSQIDLEQPFVNYGLDSVEAVRLTADLEDWLDCKLSPTLAYDYPNIASLAAYLQTQKSEVGSLKSEQFLNKNNSEIRRSQKIAIVGMACRFPGASNCEAFWQLLAQGKEAIGQDLTRHNLSYAAGYIKDYDQFDPQFFDISEREAINTDPQQRLLLEVTYEALENANLPLDNLSGSSTGVFIGISSSDYAHLQVKKNQGVNIYTGTGNAFAIAANRISYCFNLIGPSLSVDTACSSSLVALHLAVNSLKNGECEYAIAGGVNLILSGDLTETFAKAGMMANDSKCKTFDAKADGYVRGEGCGVVILKPLEQAIASGDKILAVIHGSAINQDGKSNGLTAPSGKAQQRVIQSAWHNAGVKETEISYLEAHGTGTALGDPIEVNSLAELLPSPDKDTISTPGEKTEPRTANGEVLYIGSAKTNIGHLEAAAGIAGLIKTVLALNHQVIPPTLNFEKLNPYINLEQSRLQIAADFIPWPISVHPRYAGISSFGFGGTNAHVVISDYGENSAVKSSYQPSALTRNNNLLTLSAKSESALQELIQRYQDYLDKNSELNLADVCFTSNIGRSHFKHRAAFILNGNSHLELTKTRKKAPLLSVNYSPIAFLFTGQGSQYPQMGYELYTTSPTFKSSIDQCEEILTNYLEIPLTEVLFNPENQEILDQTIYTQPAIFAVEYALANLWLSWGIQPSVVMGHSVGEYVAATIGQVFSLEDGLKLIAYRGKLMQELPLDGGMICLFTNVQKAKKIIANYRKKVSIAAINSESNIVISGSLKDLEKIEKKARKEFIKTKKLKVSHAFHSPLMQPILSAFKEIAWEINYNEPQVEIISNVTGTVNKKEIATAEYWVKHIIEPVKFAQSIESLNKNGYKIYLEIGAKPTLLGMARALVENQVNKTEKHHYLWLPSLRKDGQDWQHILNSLASLYESGFNPNWVNFHQDYPSLNLVSLPNYPWQHQRYWLDDNRENQTKNLDWFYKIEWKKRKQTLGEKNGTLPLSKKQVNYLIFADKSGLAERLAAKLTDSGNKVSLVYKNGSEALHLKSQFRYWLNPNCKEDYENLWQNLSYNIDKIIYFWALDNPEQNTVIDLENTQFLSTLPVVYLLQSLAQTSNYQAKLWLFSQSSQLESKVASKDSLSSINPQGSCLWGLGKVIALEHPEYWGGLVDLDADYLNSDLDLLENLINQASPETMVAIRGENSYYARLTAIKRPISSSSHLSLSSVNPEATYLITGGLGALGFQTAKWLVSQQAKNLVLVSRSKPSSEIQNQIQTWQTQGINVLVTHVDIADFHSLQSLFSQIESSLPPLQGIIHCAGVIHDRILMKLSPESFKLVMQPKVQGAWNLHQLTLNKSLDFFLLFSSVASLLGSPGQGNYSAANAFLDAIAAYRHSLNLPALSINWGAFDIGMAQSQHHSLTAMGIDLLSADEGIDLLGNLINYSGSQLGVMKINWQKVASKFPDLANSPYIRGNTEAYFSPSPVLHTPIPLVEQLKETAPEARETLITNYLKEAIAPILNTAPEKINSTDSLLDLGMDSLMVMEAINHLKTDLQLMLYPREFYERPRINALASYLAQEFNQTYSPSEVKSQNVQVREHFSHTPIADSRLPTPDSSSQAKLPTPIAFILSSPRSGSTLLRVMLAGHASLLSPPELHLLPFATMQERQAELEASHLGEGLIRTLMDLKHIDAEASQSLVNQWVQDNLSISELYQILQNLAGDRLLIDKSPTYGMAKSTLIQAETIFSQAKYIYLVRHPYSVIESFARMRMDKLLALNNANPYEIAESIWAQTNQNIMEFLGQINSARVCQIHYENLVTEPRPIMEQICEFLAIPFAESVLNPYQGERMTDGVYRQSMSVGDPNFKSRQQIDPNLAQSWRTIQLPITLNHVSRQLAQSLNYELPHEVSRNLNSDTNLSSSPQLKTKPTIITPNSFKEEYVNVRGLNLCLCSWGNKNHPLILLVHGILDQGFAWEQVAQPLVAKGYYVVAPDLRGHGKSDHVGKGGSYNLLDFVSDLDSLTNYLTEQPFTLVGHSLGSVITGIFASIRPQKVAKLVLVEPVLPVESNSSQDVHNIVTHLDYLTSPPTHPVFPNIEAIAQRLQKATPALSAEFAQKLAQRISKSCQNGVTFSYSALLTTRAGIGFNSISRSQYLLLLEKIKAPIQLIYGKKSNFNRPEDLEIQQKTMKNALKSTLNGGHNLHLEESIKLASLISSNNGSSILSMLN